MLKLKIKNYKSIREVEYNIYNNINYIIGKNESGKSNVIGAIDELNSTKIEPISKNFNSEGETLIEYRYLIKGELAKEWKNLIGIDDVWFHMCLDEEGHKCYIDQIFEKEVRKKLKGIYNVEDFKDEKKLIPAIEKGELLLCEGKEDTDLILEKIRDLINRSMNFNSMYKVTLYNEVDFPYLQKVYTFDAAKNDKTFLALWKLLKQDEGDIDKLIILKDDEQLDLKNELQKNLSVELKSFINDFWKQKTITFKIDIKDNEFVVRAADLFDDKAGKFKSLDLRSSGMISYLTLVLFISSLDLSKENIVLLDEPASKLHASAVLDLKKFFQKSHKNLKFVVATHNTSFIDWGNIDKFNLAINGKNGTELINKFVQQAIGEEKSGLSPFLYKLGIDKEALFSISSNINVFVEGIHDVILLRSMYKIYKEKEDKKMDLNFIPLGSATKQNSLIALSFATNKNIPYFIFDNDNAGEQGVKKIRKEFYDNEDQKNIFFINAEDYKNGYKIETQDLFLEEQFDNKVIKDNKSFNYYHALAKAIAQKEHNPSDEAYKNFKKLFDKIK